MTRLDDLTGQVFTRLFVVERGPDHITRDGKRTVQWWCECQCGEKVLVRRSYLVQDQKRSCGCLAREAKRRRSIAPVTYPAMRYRLRTDRGRPETHPCISCGQPATHWAYVGGCAEELLHTSPGTWPTHYCMHAEHYEPRCNFCKRPAVRRRWPDG